jgi:predicted RNA-binding protein with TRAM domain
MERRRGFHRNRGFGGGRRFDVEKPVKIGEEYDVTISDVGSRGDGVTKINNFIVFVPNVKRGEKVKIRIKEVANRFAIAEKIGTGSEEEVKEETVVKEEAVEEETVEEEKSEEEPVEEVVEEEPVEEEKDDEEKTEEESKE